MFTLQILHASDLEGGVQAISNAPNFAALVDGLEADATDLGIGSILLSAGDNYIPGPLFNAAGDRATFRDSGLFNDFYNDFFSLSAADGYGGLREGSGRVDISIMNVLGFDASAIGNHEFDVGSDAFESIIEPDFRGDGLADDRWVGSQFPFLSANLDFSNDGDLANLFTSDILLTTAFQTGPDQSLAGTGTPKIAPAAIIEEAGEQIGVVGATTQILEQISSPTGTTVIGAGENDMVELAGLLQPVIDDLTAQGVNKIVIVSHLQQIALEKELAGLLSGVDVIIAGGSDTIQADATDVLRPGDTAQEGYPFLGTDADGNPVAVVSTAGEYSYLGRLVVTFDDNGVILPDSIDEAQSGAFASLDDVVASVADGADLFAEGSKADRVSTLTDAAEGVVIATDGNTFGSTSVYLNGERASVRTEETNLGNLTADANLAEARKFDDTVLVSHKNGGGIRAPIGEVDAAGNDLPPQANPLSGKEEGEVSQLDIENALRFNNGLTLITLTPDQLLEVIEHSVAGTAPGATPGQFGQWGGLRFSYDPDFAVGERVVNVALEAEDGTLTPVVVDGDVAAGAPAEIRIVTLNFLADGGDGYPFPDFVTADPDFANRQDLAGTGEEGVATFAPSGTEQDALAEFLAENFSDGTVFDRADVPASEDTRIQDLNAVTADTVLPEGDDSFTLQILHASDLEGGVAAIDNAPNFAAVVDALESDAAEQGIESILLSAGDNYIPGPLFNAGGDFSLAATYEGFYNAFFGLIDESVIAPEADTNGDGFFDNGEIEAFIATSSVTFDDIYTTDVNGDGFKDYFEEIDTFEGRVDIAIMNALGFDASAVGNHEFDAGTDAFENIINYDSEEGNSLSGGRFGTPNFLQEVDTPGVQFPYLTANLDFSQDFDVGALFTNEILPSTAFQSDLLSARDNPADPAERGSDSNDSKIAPATIVERDGEQIGVVGATTQLIAQISSTGTINDISSPGLNDMPALAAVLQPVIDDLVAQGVNKIVLVSHLQQFALETELAGLLSGIDVIVAGGSDTLLADDQDRLRSGDEADAPYPVTVTNADGDPTVLLSTDGEYSYVGRLVVTFDENGVVDASSIDADVSGAFATDDQGVVDVTGAATAAEAIAASDKATDVENLADSVVEIVTATDADIAGQASVYLNGERSEVRTQETNLGNLTADANLVAAQAVDPEVTVSLKNGGGIRAPIGAIIDQGDGEAIRTVTQPNPLSGKEEGEISELDIDNALRFNNGLVTVDLTPEELKIILEHGVSATVPGSTPGQFPQVGGLHFSFDPDGTAQVLGDGGTVVTEGTRVQNITLLDADGNPSRAIVRDGEVVDGAPSSIKVVTLDFLAGGGDGYPFSDFSDVTDLGVGEQQALSDFLRANFPEDSDQFFSIADTEAGRDARIQNLNERSDTADAPVATNDLRFQAVAEFQGEGGEGASEVVAHEGGKLYVTNGELGRIDIFDIATESQDGFIDLTGLDGFDGLQSVAVANGVVAAAISRDVTDADIFGTDVSLSQPGFVALFDAASGDLLSTVDVGNLPDQLTFSADGGTLLVAGEGEKNDDSDNDDNPLGTVAVIDVTDPTAPSTQILDFTAFNGLEDAAREAGIRVQEGVSIAEDLEPEFVAVSPDGTTAFVSLQENNAIAKIDLASGETTDIFSLGLQDFSEVAIDANDNGIINIRTFDNLVGFRMADSIASFEANGQTYVATANEGDSRDFDEDRVADLFEDGRLDPGLVEELLADGLIDEDPDTDIGIERLEVSTIDGDTDGDGDIDVIHAFNSRSFSIFDADGTLVFDSGSDFEKIIAERAPERFNDDDGDDGEDRSDAKGPEPEAITTGDVDGRLYAFIGLERDSGIMIYDITEPSDSFFVNYIPPIFVDNAAEGEIARHGPEIITFISGDESTTGNAQIAVSYEISGSTVVYDLTPEPTISIGAIQGAGHVSAFVGSTVATTGIVTAVDFNGYYLQDGGDGDDATSDGIFVFTGTGTSSPVAVGDEVRIEGTVSEFIPGGAGTGNLSTTQISTADALVLSSDNELPDAVVIGAAGRPAPTDVIISEDELPVNLQEVPGTFNPETDGIDFYESLEGMRVTVDNPVAISATNRFDETWVVTDDGEGVTSPSNGLNDRGGLNLNADADGFGDLNPERVQIQYDSFFDLLPDGFTPPDITLGDDLSDVTGVVGYSFGNFEVLVTEAFEIEEASANTPETTTISNDGGRLTVAAYNILNVTANPDDGDAEQIDLLADQIVTNLGAPDIIALQEVQDDSGVTDDGTLDATATLTAIVDAIAAAGGPEYAFASAEVDEDGETGGVPGGNIRNAYLYNPARVVANEIVTLEAEELAAFGVTDPTTFDGTRDPLLGSFTQVTGFGNLDNAASGLVMEEAQEVTPTPDTAANASFDVTFDADTNVLSIDGTFADLTSPLFNVGPEADVEGNPQSALHMHTGAAGTNGPIARNLTVTDNGDGSGSFTGTFTLTDEEAATLAEEGFYLNLHTETNMGGELRGQISLNDDALLGEEITLINNHFTSRFGSEPIFGGPQPFFQAGEAEREAEATAINQVVDALLADDPEANVVVLGDLNTFEFTDELTEDLPGVGDERVLTNLIDALPGDEAYTFVFQGNSQVLDHIFVTDSLVDGAEIDIVHVNNDFPAFASDHEPVVASFDLSGSDDSLPFVAAYPGTGDVGGDTLSDVIGGNDGALLNGAAVVAGGIAGAGLSFDGVDDVAVVANSADFDLADGAVSFWFLTDVEGDQGLVSKDSLGLDDGGHLNIELDDNAVEVRLQSADASFTVESGDLAEGQPHHVVVNFGEETGLQLYVDGVLADTSDFTGGLGGNEEAWTFGASQRRSGDLTIDPLVNFFQGQMDEIAIFDEALSADQVVSLFEQGANGEELQGDAFALV